MNDTIPWGCRRGGPMGLLAACWCVGVGACVLMASLRPEPELRHPAVVGSAAVTVGWMLLAWYAMVLRAGGLARRAWTLGFFMVLVHFVLAFGMAHAWSHAAAVDHVRAVGGAAEGIWVNYLFALAWGADVAWWWRTPAGHAGRPRWVRYATHGFLLFVVVNATVVFGPEERRVLYGVPLGLLALLWLRDRRAANR